MSENHIGDLNEMVSDAVAKCESCGVPWAEHMGIMGVCATNAQLRKERDAARRERDLAILLNEIDEIGRLRIENAWHSERDEARREACERTAENLSLLGSSVRLSTLRVEHAARRGWDCYAEPRWKSDPRIISPEELARCTRNQTP